MRFIWENELGKDGKLVKHELELMVQWGIGTQSLLKHIAP